MKKGNHNLYLKDRMSRVINMLKMDHSLYSLEEAFSMLTEIKGEEKDITIKKLLAEICYLIAMEHKKRNEYEEAYKYAQMSIDLYKECNISTLEDSMPILSELMPTYMHEGVVKSSLLVEEG